MHSLLYTCLYFQSEDIVCEIYRSSVESQSLQPFDVNDGLDFFTQHITPPVLQK